MRFRGLSSVRFRGLFFVRFRGLFFARFRRLPRTWSRGRLLVGGSLPARLHGLLLARLRRLIHSWFGCSGGGGSPLRCSRPRSLGRRGVLRPLAARRRPGRRMRRIGRRQRLFVRRRRVSRLRRRRLLFPQVLSGRVFALRRPGFPLGRRRLRPAGDARLADPPLEIHDPVQHHRSAQPEFRVVAPGGPRRRGPPDHDLPAFLLQREQPRFFRGHPHRRERRPAASTGERRQGEDHAEGRRQPRPSESNAESESGIHAADARGGGLRG